MKILLLLHSELDCNSGYHADIFASKLVELGHEVFIVHAGAGAHARSLPYRAATHLDFFINTADHLRAFPPDLVHAWTPREIVRLLWRKLEKEYPERFKLIIHFEDNEPLLAEAFQPEMIATGSNLGFYDPERGGAFIDRADGFTLVTESLNEIVPLNGRPCFTLNPPYDDRLFAPAPRNDSWRREQNIPDETVVVAYTGNVHRLNQPDVERIYQAATHLSRHRRMLLVRTGAGIAIGDAGGPVLDLGVIPRSEMPGILAAADLFIQPGRPGPFDNYRFPSKIPEMAITGRPVICPELPCLSAFKDREEVFKCAMDEPNAIGEAVTAVISTPGLNEKLSRGSVRAAMRECDPAKTAPALGAFFHELSTPGA